LEVVIVTAAVLGDRGVPWTEEDYLALGETKDRVELIDGSLIVSPAPTPRHQHLSRRLANALEPAVEEAGLEIYEAINVRLRRGRIPIPDLAIVEPINPDEAVVHVAAVRLICEIVSPSNPAGDRVLKMQLYAEAGIPWYLLVEPEPKSVIVQLFRLDSGHYTEHAAGAPGLPLELTDPIVTVLDPAVLLPPQR
jgi:Uma2 family endonuclease